MYKKSFKDLLLDVAKENRIDTRSAVDAFLSTRRLLNESKTKQVRYKTAPDAGNQDEFWQPGSQATAPASGAATDALIDRIEEIISVPAEQARAWKKSVGDRITDILRKQTKF
jgi:hypothetical protein